MFESRKGEGYHREERTRGHGEREKEGEGVAKGGASPLGPFPAAYIRAESGEMRGRHRVAGDGPVGPFRTSTVPEVKQQAKKPLAVRIACGLHPSEEVETGNCGA